MPNFAKTYANYCGVKLPETPPFFPVALFPVPAGDYITVHSGAGHPARVYSYYSDVMAMVIPYLKKHNIKILQIGASKDPKVTGAIDMRGKTNIRQAAFVLKNSKLHVGSDSLWSHVAGSFNIPSIILFSPNPKEVTTPHYKSDYFYAIEPDFEGKRHSYAVDDHPRLINSIKPEVVAQKILDHFNLDQKIDFETVRIGDNYKIVQYDFIPDCEFNIKISGEKLVCRLDVVHNLKYASSMLSRYKAVILTKKPIEKKFIDLFKHNIDTLVYKIDDKFDLEFIKYIDGIGLDYMLVTDISDKKLKSDIKLKLFDYNDVVTISPLSSDGLTSDMYFKTNRITYGRGNFYDSVYHYKNAENSNIGKARQIGEAINDEDFLTNLESYYIFKKL